VLEVKKSRVFWVGFSLLGLVSLLFFWVIWVFVTTTGGRFYFRVMLDLVPPIVGWIVILSMGLYMMKGERTTVFWTGLFILGFASIALFGTLWYSFVLFGDPSYLWNWALPFTVGSVVFILIGLYLIKAGTEQEH